MPLTRILTVLLPCAVSAETGAEAFAGLRGLVGAWEAQTAAGFTIRVSYRAIASDSAVVETFTTPSGRETLTIYHPDGSDLIATHYCVRPVHPVLFFAFLLAIRAPVLYSRTFVNGTVLGLRARGEAAVADRLILSQ